MRFSRSNFSRLSNDLKDEQADGEVGRTKAKMPAPPQMPTSSETARNTDSIAASEIEGRGDAPIWQRAFVLGPNVRFTRTPDTALPKRATPADPAPAGIMSTPSPAPEPSATAPMAPVRLPSVAAENSTPIVAQPEFLPQPPDATGARALSYRLRRELARSRQTEEAPAEASATQENLPAAATIAQAMKMTAVTHLDLAQNDAAEHPITPAAPIPSPADAHSLPLTAFISDHVFWEAMSEPNDETESTDLLLQVAPPVAAVVAASAAIPTPVIATAAVAKRPVLAPPTADAGWSVTSLYREVGLDRISHALPGAATAAEAIPVFPTAPEAGAVPSVAKDAAEQSPIRNRTASARTVSEGEYDFPSTDLLQLPQSQETHILSPEALEQSAGLLESVLEDFGVKGEIIDVRPGPVVTLYEFEPAPGVKSSRVIGLSDDIARSMSALSARVAVVPGRNVIGIELPNPVRETVYFRELIESRDYTETRFQLPVCLGKTIGGEPVIAELAKMPHLLVAGTTGSGKSVAINTMILSLLYRLKPEECRLIMVDPKMLELSVYDGIPHLLTPVVTDPKKAVMALKWAVREMEDRYRKMSRLGVRNIDGYNGRAAAARARGETILCTIQTGFDRSTGEAIYEQEKMDLSPMPYIVVIVDEMADLMMVAGKEIEGAIQRLAQMARAAGIHLIMATQRPSVDVITGTIKANFPTRISFQVTSKIDSRTILGEQGAEHLLGQGDMLHMMGGGRIARVHGPFVSDHEVEKVVAHLKTQGRPEYLGTVTEDADETETEEDEAVFDRSAMGEEDATDLYDKAVKIVMRDKKCSTSYIQRKLSIGYNRAASLVERMEQEGLVGPANHVGKRAIIADGSERGDGAV
ncbi:DNA translocase FtsK [Ciceribacter ferrooxidans]|uniref:DNA translocase FtsK n=1 Tax=Ciceribacter ferrooxidans TaxID=2509717 RepID=A0A4Q2SZ14_9HYPH|nr:DNA translocase FtsK [Ciceribacter ferrooxidans]RYC10751.1 DNA translocase FtsK [Ciceribacter ferrooxidans]